MAKQVNRYGAYTDMQLEDPRIAARAMGTAVLTQQLQKTAKEASTQRAKELEELKKDRLESLEGFGVQRAQVKKVGDKGHNYDFATMQLMEDISKDEMKDLADKQKGDLTDVDYAIRKGIRDQWMNEVVLYSGTIDSNLTELSTLLLEGRLVDEGQRPKDYKFMFNMAEEDAPVTYGPLDYDKPTLKLIGSGKNAGAEIDLSLAYNNMNTKGEMFFRGYNTDEEIAEDIGEATELLLADIDTVKEKHTAVEMQAKDDVTGELLFESDGKTPIMTTGRRDYAVQDEVAAREIWEAKGLSILDDVEKHELFRFLSRQKDEAGNPYITGTYGYSAPTAGQISQEELATAYIEYLVERGLKERTLTNEQFNPIPTK